MDPKGKTAVVTGGAVRVGRAIAIALSEAGVNVAVHYHRSAEAAEQTVDEIRGRGVSATAIQADLSNSPQAARRIIEQTAAELGPPDVLINNAAVFERGGLAEVTEDQWDHHFCVNLKAPLFLCREFAAQGGWLGSESGHPVSPASAGTSAGSRRRPAASTPAVRTPGRRGHIINIADWRGTRADPQFLIYSLTKGGLVKLTEALAVALAPDVRVNGVAPGAILPPPGQSEKHLDRLKQAIPLRRVGSAGDVAEAVLYLLRSEFITGEMIHVTGGQQLGGIPQ